MRPILSLILLLALPAYAKRPDAPTVAKVPSIEEVVAAEGFTPTPSQSEIYKPGAVLVPNGRGGHDVVVSNCIDSEPDIAIMSQSSIATTLAGGVSARLGVARGTASAGVEKRLSFVDPEQRTISLGQLRPTDACLAELQTATQLQDLSDGVVLNDVLVAIIKNTVCTRADASGRVVALGEAEAAAFSECVQESDGQVPLGYKALPLKRVLAVVGASLASPDVPVSRPAAPPAAATSSVEFGDLGGLGVQEKLREQACDEDAQSKGASARTARMAKAGRDAQTKASAAWSQIAGEAEACTKLRSTERTPCIQAVERWLSIAREMPIELPAGVEKVPTDCGPRAPAFPAERKTVAANEIKLAESILDRLRATEPPKSEQLSELTGEINLSRSVLAGKSETFRMLAREKRHESMKFLKDILTNRAPAGTQKAEMMLRLAELYQEEGFDIAMDGGASVATKWFELSIKLYEQIRADFPTYARVDQAMFFQANSLYSLGRKKDATTLYIALTKTYPDSSYIPEAFVYIGEHYFDENNAYKALQAYKRATRYRDSPHYAFANYKLAWCYYNVGETGQAIEAMKGVVQVSMRSSQDNDPQKLISLQNDALQALVRFYRDSGAAEEGRVYFMRLGRSDLADSL